MPCGCDINKREVGTKVLILRNPKTGKIIAKTTVPKVVNVKKGPQLLPGYRRIIKPETIMNQVNRPRRLMI